MSSNRQMQCDLFKIASKNYGKKKPHHRVVMILSLVTFTEHIEIFYNSGYLGFGVMQAVITSLQPRLTKHSGQVYITVLRIRFVYRLPREFVTRYIC